MQQSIKIPDHVQLVLVRGLPGSGKSTFAKSLEGFVHLETDMWFMDGFGNYRFDPRRLREYHLDCQFETRRRLVLGQKVVVSNTFTQRWEMEPYYKMGYFTHEITMTGNFGNIHGVPQEAIDRMRDRWED